MNHFGSIESAEAHVSPPAFELLVRASPRVPSPSRFITIRVGDCTSIVGGALMCISSVAWYVFQPHASERDRVFSAALGGVGGCVVLSKCREIWRQNHALPPQIVEEGEDLELGLPLSPPPTVSGSPRHSG